MKSRMILMLICVGILFGAILISKTLQKYISHRHAAARSYVVTVSTMKAGYSSWDSKLKATGSMRAVTGVSVTTELAGMVKDITFTPGAMVAKDALLVQLNIDSDVALLHSLQANAELAKITYDRDKAQYAVQAVSKQTVDSDAANLKSLQAQVEEQIATIAKKTIRAPFGGRLGISAVNPGQYVNPGDKVVTLQTLDPIYIDFYVPQQSLIQLGIGQPVTVTTDSFPGKAFTGKITTIDPLVDVNTRNVEVEATISNPSFELTPGMFAYAEVVIGAPKPFITLPQTAVSFNPYGSIIYYVEEKGKDAKGNPNLIAKQRFVTTGDTRGDQVTILSGVKEGETIVTSGQLKLKNGSPIAINNSVVPSNNPSPKLPNDY